jgi:hypothetical protein
VTLSRLRSTLEHMFDWPADDDAFDAALLSAAELKTQIVALAESRRELDRRELCLLAELDARSATLLEDGLHTFSWLGLTTQIPRRVASGRVADAVKLRDSFPLIAQAFRDGVINAHHVQSICRAANARTTERLVEVQQQLIDLVAICVTFDAWQEQLTSIAKLADSEGSFDPREAIDANYLRLLPQYNGMVRLDGQLSPDNAKIVAEAIDREAQKLFASFSTDFAATGEAVIPPLPTLRALGLVDVVRRSNGSSGAPFKPAADVTLVVEAARATSDDCTESTRNLMCDAVFTTIVVDSLGTPLDAGRTVRLATPVQRRALKVRDGGCVFPGCSAPAEQCEAHHVVHFLDGGPTDLNNLALLCKRHHALAHTTGWSFKARHHDGFFEWTTPSGKTYAAPRHQMHVNPPPIVKEAEPEPPPGATHSDVDPPPRQSRIKTPQQQEQMRQTIEQIRLEIQARAAAPVISRYACIGAP